MDYVLPMILVIISVSAMVVVIAILRKRKRASLYNTENVEMASPNDVLLSKGDNRSALNIPIELLPATVQIEEKNLVEITDQTVIARISQTLPTLANAVAKTLSSRVANEAMQKANEILKDETIFRVVLKEGGKLVPSKKMRDAFAPFSRSGNKINEQAKLVRPNIQNASGKLSKAANVTNAVANVMNIASLIVGQYYIAAVDSKLQSMTKSIDKISDFQDREFKSRILSVISLVSEISQFSKEVLEDDNQRKRKLSALEDIKATTTELLGQVNITIAEIIKVNSQPDHIEYRSAVEKMKTLIEYQIALTAVLEEISKLTYLLGKGTISPKQCYIIFNKYTEMSIQTRTMLGEWHEKQVETLRINMEKERIQKIGLDAVLSTPLSWIDEKYAYNTLDKAFVHEIASQQNRAIGNTKQLSDVYDEDVELIIRGGKYYYLPKQQRSYGGGEDEAAQELGTL